MKFKNYVNSHTGDNRIYSLNDITQMPLGDVLKNKEELLSQYRVLGVPTESELQDSDNVVYVQAYTREDGTEVKAHYRSKPDGSESNNFSHGTPTGGAANYELGNNDAAHYIMTKIYGYSPVDVSTPEKVQKLMYPDEIAGVKRGKPKTIIEVAQRQVNPKYGNFETDDYIVNCQSCVIATHLQLMGIDVQAGSGQTSKAKELSRDISFGYLNPKTGKICVPEILNLEKISCSEYLKKNAPPKSLYVIGYSSKLDSSDEERRHGHVLNLGKDEKGTIFFYDGQDNEYHEGEDAVYYIDSWIKKDLLNGNPEILRVDNKIINPYYINSVVIPHENF